MLTIALYKEGNVGMQTGTLYLVATPIGNLGDLSQRAIDTLGLCDMIAAEDTRRTVTLLNHLAIKKPLLSYYEHNKKERGGEIIERLLKGENVALVTDAGTPAISDPGEDMVRLCATENIPVISIPGACALISGLIISGLSTGRFCFEGFLSVNKKQRREHLLAVKDETRTMIFYEAPHKLRATLADFYETWGERKIALCREITKIHEDVMRTTLSRAISHYEEVSPRGEYVLVIEGAAPRVVDTSDIDPVELVEILVTDGMDQKSAIKEAAQKLGIPKREVYEKVHGLSSK